ncbi:hypothetical protein HG536_0G02320 [Torulaspora globosa]|uniref:N-terminal acetyltransferase B complex subunit MDM20 n=1 Tax=Torulaspora globosa TaxID=48254 RepID=A0A7G3ZLI5_9SACH|nr:uncharacterized protein HG536_0G02320 [Torulaspora globosa]QLL34371.1 hypothetical protein HG536_0G02320 [Torulaspora globosa]
MTSRVDDEISNLMKRGSYKLCLQKVVQSRKQLPNSSYLKVLEIYIKFRMSPRKFNYEDSLGRLYGTNGTEITSDTRALNLLHTFFVELGRYEEALQVYERANFKYQGFEIALTWFEKTLRDSNYKQMVKSCQQLAKLGGDLGEGLSHRDYIFWYALSIVVLFRFQSHKVADQEKRLLPQLAYRSLCNVKPFQSAQEVYVFCTVCEELFPDDEQKAQEIIQEVIPRLERSVDLYMKNFFLRNLKKDEYSTAFDLCGKLLERLNDFELITRYIHAAKNLSKSKEETLQNIALYVGDSRNSRLAHLEADRVYDNRISKAALGHYVQKFHNKSCCTTDLNGYRDFIDESSIRETFNECDGIDLLHEVNLFKLGLSEFTPVQAYVKYESTLVSKPITDYSACSTYILRIMQDLILTEDEPPLENVLLALTLLENYQIKDPHNYETSVWIVALYMYLGCVPLAFPQYLMLKTKNVQVDIADFIVYSRFATMFPLKTHDYIKRAYENLEKFYQSSAGRLSQLAQIAFERKSYSKIIGILEFNDRIDRSSMKWLMASESVKMARLCNDKRGELLQSMHEQWRLMEMIGNISFSDNRDYRIFGPDIQQDKLPHVLRYLSVSDEIIMLDCIKEFMIELIPSRERDAKLESYLEKMRASGESPIHAADSVDAWSFEVFHDLYANDGANLLELVKNLSLHPQSTSTWRLSHEYLTKMHTLKTLDSFKRIKDSALKDSIKTNIKLLRDSCDSLFSQYISHVTEMCGKLETGPSGQLLQSLGYAPLDAENITKGLLTVQKATRNL